MNLQAEIARIQLRSLPESIAERVLKHCDVARLIEAGSANVDDVGQFKFADVRNVLATAPLDVFVNVNGPSGSDISVARSVDALFRVRGPSDKEVLLPELSLLDPSKKIRLTGIKHLSNRALPIWPRSLHWQDKVSERPLSDSDFGQVLDEVWGVVEPVISGVVRKLQGPEFEVLDIVPTRATYYESLLGSTPSFSGAPQYVSSTLMPHLAAIFGKNPSWGLICMQAVCIADAIDPVLAAAHVSNDDLLSAIESVGSGRTPFAVLATYKLASARASADGRFSEISKRALHRLIERTCGGDDTFDHDELLIALVKLTLNVVGQAEELALTPPFWRRLAAFAHAITILEAIHIPDKTAKDFAIFFNNRLTRESVAVEILDHLAEPRWHANTLRGRDLWASALLSAMQGASEDAESSVLSSAQLERAKPYLDLVAGMPDPLSGARQDWVKSAVNVLSEDIFDSVESAEVDGEAIEPVRIWLALAHNARIHPFSDGLLLRIRDMVKTTSQTEAGFREIYEILELCCNVASAQADMELADAVVARVIETCRECADSTDAKLATLLVILAAGAAEDRQSGLLWAAEKLEALAYQLPRGPSCTALAESIAMFQRLIPIGKRRWDKALVIASSAAA